MTKLTRITGLLLWICITLTLNAVAQQKEPSSNRWITRVATFLKQNKPQQALSTVLESIHAKREQQLFSEIIAKRLSDLFRNYSRFEEEKHILELLQGKMESEKAEMEVLYMRMVNSGILFDYSTAFKLSDSLFTLKHIPDSYPDLYRKMLSNQVLLLSNVGQYHRSNARGNELLPLCLAAKDSVEYFNVLTTMAYNYSTLEEYETALHYLLQTLDYRLRNNFELLAIYSYLNLGDLYAQLHRYDEAEFSLIRALHLTDQVQRVDLKLWIINYLSYVVFQNGDDRKSEQLYKQAHELIKKFKLEVDKPVVEHTRLLVAAETKDWKKAKELIAYLDSVASPNTPELQVPPLIRFRFESAQGKYDKALDILKNESNHDVFAISSEKRDILNLYTQVRTEPEKALFSLEKLIHQPIKTRGIGSDFSKALSSESDRSLLIEAIEPLLEQKLLSPSHFFSLTETWKSSLILQRLKQNSSQKNESVSQKKLLQKYREEVAYLQLMKTDTLRIDSLKRKLSDLEIRLKETASITMAWEKPELSAFQKSLGSSSIMVHLLKTGSYYQSLWITTKNAFFHDIGSITEVDSLINQVIRDCTEANNENYRTSTTALSRLFFPASVAQKIKDELVTDLLISPDGLWWSVPFEVLPIETRFSIEKLGIRVLPCFTSTPYLSVETDVFASSKQVLALSNPRFPEQSPWISLPFTRIETESISRYFPDAVVLTDIAATHSALLEHLNQQKWDIIHLASHGKAGRTPESSRIVLAHFSENASSYLFPNSLPANSVPAELIVLSACESAAGHYISGEGIWSMQRAWMNAGAKSVLASLWSVNDKGTAIFMEHFYQQLAIESNWLNRLVDRVLESELSPSYRYRAIRGAQLHLINQTTYHHPYYWSGFVYIGL